MSPAVHECIDYEARSKAAAALAYSERVEEVTATKLDFLKEASTQTICRLEAIEEHLVSMQKHEGTWKLNASAGVIAMSVSACAFLFVKVMGW